MCWCFKCGLFFSLPVCILSSKQEGRAIRCLSDRGWGVDRLKGWGREACWQQQRPRVHRTHLSRQLHLQTDMWSETEGKTKRDTDAAEDGQDDPGCSWKDPFSNQQSRAAIFRISNLGQEDKIGFRGLWPHSASTSVTIDNRSVGKKQKLTAKQVGRWIHTVKTCQH